jgi:hypothetical protein
MPFIHVNDFYINVDHISHIEKTPTEIKIYFGSSKGVPCCTAVPVDSEVATRLLQSLD